MLMLRFSMSSTGTTTCRRCRRHVFFRYFHAFFAAMIDFIDYIYARTNALMPLIFFFFAVSRRCHLCCLSDFLSIFFFDAMPFSPIFARGFRRCYALLLRYFELFHDILLIDIFRCFIFFILRLPGHSMRHQTRTLIIFCTAGTYYCFSPFAILLH